MTLLSAILENRNKIFRKNKFFEFLIDHLSVEHLTPENLSKLDVSEIIGDFVNANGRDLRNYIRAYIQNASGQGLLREVLPSKLVEVIEAAQSGSPSV